MTPNFSRSMSLITLQALELLKAAYDRGLNTWDTANTYSNGASEEIVGKALKKFNIPRHKVVILSKCRWGVGEEPGKHHLAQSHSHILMLYRRSSHQLQRRIRRLKRLPEPIRPLPRRNLQPSQRIPRSSRHGLPRPSPDPPLRRRYSH